MRYKKLPKHKGIYEDTTNGKLWCQKRIKGKLHSQTCDNLKEAQHWIKNFHPDSPMFSKIEITDFSDMNGRKSATFSDVWNLYKEEHLATLQKTSQEARLTTEGFLLPVMKNDIRFATSQFIGQLIIKNKKLHSEKDETKRRKRTCFDNELTTLKAMLEWWRANFDGTFYNPVLKSHFEQGVIRKTVKRNTVKMTEEIVSAFLKEMYRIGAEGNLYAMLAETQYLITGRIQEPTGLTADKANFDTGLLIFDQAMAFTRTKVNSDYLKNTKTNAVKIFKLKGRLKEIILTLKNRGLIERSFLLNIDGIQQTKKVKFLFHIDGHPLTYRQVQYRYDQALKSLGLYPQFSSTHIMRHASSNHVRKKFGLDHAQVAGAWNSAGVAEMYSGTDESYRDENIEYLESRLQVLN